MAILALLIGLLVPSLSRSRRQAKAHVCLSKLKDLGSAFTIYLTENRDAFPPHRLKTLSPESTEVYVNEYDNKAPRWQWFLKLGMGPVIDPKPFRRLGRPWGDGDLGQSGSNISLTMTNETFVCPALDDPQFSHDVRNGAYGYNYQYLGNARQDTDPKRWDNFAVSLHRIKATAGTVLLGDSRGADKKHGLHSYTLDPPRLGIEVNAKQFGPDPDHVPDGQDPTEFAFSPMEPRHDDKGNVVFVDGHASAMTLHELGYHFLDQMHFVPIHNSEGVAVPDGLGGSQLFTNRLWTGQGTDRFSDKLTRAAP